MSHINLNEHRYITGEDVTLSLDKCTPFEGKIYIEEDSSGRFYVCHNNCKYDGANSPDKLGFEFSWVFHYKDSKYYNESRSVEILPIKLDDTKFHPLLLKLTDTLNTFLDKNYKNLKFLFYIKLGVLDIYDRITDEKDGYVELHSKERKKKLKIKLGRLVRKLITSYNTILPKKKSETKRIAIELKDEIIEEIHNKWASYNTLVTFELAKGEDILKGYSSKNYLKNGKLTSCMTDRFDYLKLYTNNPDKINLMIFYFQNQVCGRTLIWNCDDGSQYYDRVYYSADWIRPAIEDILKKNKYKNAKEYKLKVSLKEIVFGQYPYLDTFANKDIKNKKLTNY